MDYEKLHKDTIAKLQEMVNSGKITVETARGICADFVPESEDEKVRRVLREIVLQWKNGHQAWCSNDKEIDTILAWLEKQGEQKPIWSEEDYNEIETIACHLDNIDNEGMAEVLRNIRDKYYHTIPQSTWKPSDEQINALTKNVEYVNVGCTQSILKALLEDLKKLREE